MAGRKSDFTLPTLDDLFSTQELRDDAKLSKIRDIPLELIDDFPDHPFKVRDDEDMMQLVESVKERGVITPATVRQKEDGRYELISGHRRKRACELAGFEALRCEVVDLDRDAATVLMVESNYQRSQILPSEKAFAYKMRLEAMSRQGKRTDLTSDPVGPKLSGERSNIELSSETGDSTSQIKRYIRLTNLVQELLDLVDEGKIKMRPAVELSYLDEGNQRAVVDEIDLNQCTPSHDQTIRMRKFFTDGKLTPEVVSAIMGEEKPNQREKIVLRGDKVRSLIPKNIPVSQKASERDYLTCDENGFAQTKDMPYGIYTVHQVSGWEGSELMPDFDVFISQNGATYRYLINNAPFKEYSDYGCPYVQEDCDVQKPSDNLVIYGHHMKNGSMFAHLDKFKSESFWSEHKTIAFNTLTDRQEYEIVAVFRTVVYTDSPEAFKFYRFIDAESTNEFDDFIDKCKELSFYDTGVTAEYGDKLITLSTCEYSRNNSRLVVVAKRITEDGGADAAKTHAEATAEGERPN